MVTFAVAGHDATLPDRVLTKTGYVLPGSKPSLNKAIRDSSRRTIIGGRPVPTDTWYRSNSLQPKRISLMF